MRNGNNQHNIGFDWFRIRNNDRNRYRLLLVHLFPVYWCSGIFESFFSNLLINRSVFVCLMHFPICFRINDFLLYMLCDKSWLYMFSCSTATNRVYIFFFLSENTFNGLSNYIILHAGNLTITYCFSSQLFCFCEIDCVWNQHRTDWRD